MYLIYNLILLVLSIFYIPYLLIKKASGSYKKNIKQRFGTISEQIQKIFKDQPTIWIHAVSVGETVAASSLVKEIKDQLPEHKILFSTVTTTGQEMAHKIIDDADEIIYFPLDLNFAVKKAIKSINPELIIVMETELWPNFINQADKNNNKIMFANARISDSSYKSYKYLGPLLKDMINKVDLFDMQSEEDAKRIINLGANKNRVFSSGNTKFDQTYAEINSSAADKYYKEFKIQKNQPVFIAGSTHDDEEKHLLEVYKDLKNQYSDLVFILAPRDVERDEEIKGIFKSEGINTVKRSSIEKREPGIQDVIILNTIGELAKVYTIADLVFVGGSMMGKGGHNILEPAAQEKLVFFGPDMFNFKDSTRLLLENNVGIQVNNWKELSKKLLYYLNNKEELEAKGKKARKVILKNRGASERIVKNALKILK